MINGLHVSEPVVLDQSRVVEVVAQRLIKDWFPTRIPVDIKEWTQIARKDAESVVDELAKHGLLRIEEQS